MGAGDLAQAELKHVCTFKMEKTGENLSGGYLYQFSQVQQRGRAALA
jgi:hypothetical protein